MKKKNTLLSLRTSTYKDFIMRLIFYFDKYYLDSETLSDEEDVYNHFLFIFNKTCDDFEKENLWFHDNDQLLNYLYGYFRENIYLPDDPMAKYDKEKVIRFWKNIFDIKNQKYQEYLIILTELYQIFDYSLNKKLVLEEIY
ncbi:MAG: hypothetical protein ACOCVF_00170 [bacterium]